MYSILNISQREHRPFCGFRIARSASRYHLRRSPLLRQQLSHVHIAQAYPRGTVDQLVNHGVGLDASSELAVPVGGRVLRAGYHRAVHVPVLYQLEQEAFACYCQP